MDRFLTRYCLIEGDHGKTKRTQTAAVIGKFLCDTLLNLFRLPKLLLPPDHISMGSYSERINLQSLDTVLRETFGLFSSFSRSIFFYHLHSAHFSIAVILFALSTPQSLAHMHLLINLFFTLTHLAQSTNIYPPIFTRAHLHVDLNNVLVLDSLTSLVHPLNTCPCAP
jgi:hypothetical protein